MMRSRVRVLVRPLCRREGWRRGDCQSCLGDRGSRVGEAGDGSGGRGKRGAEKGKRRSMAWRGGTIRW